MSANIRDVGEKMHINMFFFSFTNDNDIFIANKILILHLINLVFFTNFTNYKVAVRRIIKSELIVKSV